jgi:hypothetical protein
MAHEGTDAKLSSFINQASLDDLTAIASQVFGRLAGLDEHQQSRFIQEVSRDPQTHRLLERMQKQRL